MKKIYTRELAVEEGVRNNTRLDKGFMKRPSITVYRKKVSGVRSGKTGEKITYTKNNKGDFNSLGLKNPLEISHHREGVYRFIKNTGIGREKTIEKLVSKKRKGEFSLLMNSDDFKNKSFYLYIEKQHGNTYTVRSITEKGTLVCDIDLGQYYDIAGKVVLINLSKKDGRFQVRQIIKMIED